MKIAVILQGTLRAYRPANVQSDRFEIELGEPAVARHTIELFGIPPQRVQAVFVNDVIANLAAPLQDGDWVRLLPPVGGGTAPALQVFIGGVMQGSLRENTIQTQDYRRIIGDCLRAHVPNVAVIDPFELHPNSVAYDADEARRTLIDLAQTAGRADAAVVYVPEASMGTALEMWEAYQQGKPVFAISPLVHNWVIKCLSTRVFATLDEFCAFVAAGDFERSLRPTTPSA